MSAIWNGPKNGSRKPKQLRTTSSMSRGEASPSSTHRAASQNIAICRRFAMNPTPPATTLGCLPIMLRSSTTRSTTARSVCGPSTTSTPGVHSGGLNQCIPRKRSGRSTNPERVAMFSDEVLLARIAPGWAAASHARSTPSLTPMSSVTHSMMRSAPRTASAMSSAARTCATRSRAAGR